MLERRCWQGRRRVPGRRVFVRMARTSSEDEENPEEGFVVFASSVGAGFCTQMYCGESIFGFGSPCVGDSLSIRSLQIFAHNI
jgi:hypothetical protein